jgi:hypothetical protein
MRWYLCFSLDLNVLTHMMDANIGSVCRSLCGVSAGATRAALMGHFARTDNVADISAKEGIQETAGTLTVHCCYVDGSHHFML